MNKKQLDDRSINLRVIKYLLETTFENKRYNLEDIGEEFDKYVANGGQIKTPLDREWAVHCIHTNLDSKGKENE